MTTEVPYERRPDGGVPARPPGDSIAAHVRDLVEETTTLFRQEIELARSEINEKVSQVRTGIVSLAVAGALGLSALLILLFSAVFALGLVLDLWLSALIVGGVTAVIALVLFGFGRSELDTDTLKPKRTIESLRRDRELAQEATHRGA